eukprot:530164-Rhodomonas_salina.1
MESYEDVTGQPPPPIVLRISYAMSGIVLRIAYAISSTFIGYRPTNFLCDVRYLHRAMLLPGGKNMEGAVRVYPATDTLCDVRC